MRIVSNFKNMCSIKTLDTIAALFLVKYLDNDPIILCSYPKNGRTWLKYMLAFYQTRLNGINIKLTMDDLTKIFPNLSLFSNMRIRLKRVDPRLKIVYATHKILPYFMKSHKNIFLIRDIRDALVSYYHHKKAREMISCDIDSFVTSAKELGDIIDYYKLLKIAVDKISTENLKIIRYENLKHNTVQVLADCISFLDLPVDEDLLSQAIENSSLKKMQGLEAQHGSFDFSANELKNRPNAFHSRKGKAGDYINELKPSSISKIGAFLNKNLTDSFDYNY